VKIACIFSVILMAVLAVSPVYGDPWKFSIDANITLTQNAYSDNWAGGEAGALSWTLTSNSLAESQINSWVNSKNTLRLMFGQAHNQDVDTKVWAKPVKSSDLIDFETVFRFTFGWFLDPYASGRIETQFLDTRDPEKDKYVNPVKFTESAGVSKVFIKEEKREWIARVGGGLRQYLDRDVYDIVTAGRETHTSSDAGITFDTEFKTHLAESRMTFTTKLTVFEALYYSESDELEGLAEENYWKSPDVNWENVLTANITDYVMVNLYVQLLYDKQIDLGGRLKQTLSLGLTYKFL